MCNSKKIGKLHLGFFDYSHIFNKLDVVRNKKGEVVIQSPFFTIKYDFNTGVLSGDDKDVVSDFADMIIDNYGTNITREEFFVKLKWESLDDEHNVLNVGVCMLGDSIIGWDGEINSVWFDTNPPGEIVCINFQYWTKKMLNGAWKLNHRDINNLGGSQVVFPNLLDAVKYTDKKNLKKVNKLLSEIK